MPRALERRTRSNARARARARALRAVAVAVAVAVVTSTRASALAPEARAPYSAARRDENQTTSTSTSRTERERERRSASEDARAVTLRIVAPAWSGSARACAEALGADDGVVWERPWRPGNADERRGKNIGAWVVPKAVFEFDGVRAKYGGSFSARGLKRAMEALRAERGGTNSTTRALWPFMRLRGQNSVKEFFDRASADLAVVALDPCDEESGCASSASMGRLREAILDSLGYSPRNRLGVLMGSDARRVGAKLLETYYGDDIAAAAFVRGTLHSVWNPRAGDGTSIEAWVKDVAKAMDAAVVQRGFFSQTKLAPQNATRLALIFADEANERLESVASSVRRLVDASALGAASGILDTARGTWLLCQITDDCQMNDEFETRVRVALLDAEKDSIETVDVSEFGPALGEPRPFTRSALSVPHSPTGSASPRVKHISRNQLDHHVAQTMTLRHKRTFSVLYSSAACAFCTRFLALLNAALEEIDSLVVDARVYQIDCAMNDCHDTWDEDARALTRRVQRYPTLVTYRGDPPSYARYDGDFNAKNILDFLLIMRGE